MSHGGPERQPAFHALPPSSRLPRALEAKEGGREAGRRLVTGRPPRLPQGPPELRQGAAVTSPELRQGGALRHNDTL